MQCWVGLKPTHHKKAAALLFSSATQWVKGRVSTGGSCVISTPVTLVDVFCCFDHEKNLTQASYVAGTCLRILSDFMALLFFSSSFYLRKGVLVSMQCSIGKYC